jgi:hypothetical protein
MVKLVAKGGFPMDDIERRVRKHAESLWIAVGRPQSGIDAYKDRARELVAIEDNYQAAERPLRDGEKGAPDRDPVLPDDVAGPTGEPVEPIEALENEGEFPTLTDQGEEQIPERRRAR